MIKHLFLIAMLVMVVGCGFESRKETEARYNSSYVEFYSNSKYNDSETPSGYIKNINDKMIIVHAYDYKTGNTIWIKPLQPQEKTDVWYYNAQIRYSILILGQVKDKFVPQYVEK